MRVRASIAISIDGRITPADVQSHVPLTSSRDIQQLKRLRADSDVILMGGGSYRSFPLPRPDSTGKTDTVHCILTRQADFLPDHRLLTAKTPIMIFSPCSPSSAGPEPGQLGYRWITIGHGEPGEVAAEVLGHLEAMGCRRVLLEAGSGIFGLFLAAQAIDEIHVTICPFIWGSVNTPPMTSLFIPRRQDAPRWRLVSVRHDQQSGEVYLHYESSV